MLYVDVLYMDEKRKNAKCLSKQIILKKEQCSVLERFKIF